MQLGRLKVKAHSVRLLLVALIRQDFTMKFLCNWADFGQITNNPTQQSLRKPESLTVIKCQEPDLNW